MTYVDDKNASNIRFDRTGLPFDGLDVQAAITELRQNIVCSPEYVTTTLNGTLTLSNTNRSIQILSGTATGFSVVLPNATTLKLGEEFHIFNTSNQPVAVKTSDGVTLFSLSQTSVGFLVLQANNTAPGGWVAWQVFANPQIASGVVNYNLISTTAYTTSSTTDVLITGFSLTPTAGTYAVWFNASANYTSSPRESVWTIYRAGSGVADSARQQVTSRSNQDIMLTTQTIAAFDGTQACDVRVRCDPTGGSITVNARSLILVRLGA